MSPTTATGPGAAPHRPAPPRVRLRSTEESS